MTFEKTFCDKSNSESQNYLCGKLKSWKLNEATNAMIF